jgi:hypothetical protein
MVSGRKLVALRLLGYRYSFNREAWVHRIGRGKYGPVFAEETNFGVSELPTELAGRLQRQLDDPVPIQVLPPAERSELPQRATRRRGDRLIPVRWLHDEEHKVVYVDGRPPRIGGRAPLVGSSDRVKHEHEHGRDGQRRLRTKIVPIKSSRAG